VREEKLKFWAKLTNAEGVIPSLEKVVCEIVLPKRPNGEIHATFFPSIEQSRVLEKVWQFSFTGDQKRADNTITGSIVGKKALITNSEEQRWDFDLADIRCFATVEELVITYFHERESSERPRVQARFWLTPNKMLSDARAVEHHYLKGLLVRRRIPHIKARLGNGMPVNFKKYLRYQSKAEETVVYDELVAEYDLFRGRKGVRKIDEAVVAEIDDFLVLASFASRQPSICVGWDFANDQVYSKIYRGNRSVPDVTEDVRDGLIDISDFKPFIQPAYDAYYAHPARDSIRQALYRITRIQKTITERTFVSLYSAIETLVYEFRRQQDFEFAVAAQEQWKKLKKKLKKAVAAVAKEDEALASVPSRREYLYDKLDELNRISFARALKAFYAHYAVDISDLWPLTGVETSLSDIRNKLVHGYRFEPSSWPMLMSAHENLRLISERTILAMLGWPINRSTADSRFLSLHNNLYKTWRVDWKKLTSLLNNETTVPDE